MRQLSEMKTKFDLLAWILRFIRKWVHASLVLIITLGEKEIVVNVHSNCTTNFQLYHLQPHHFLHITYFSG